MSTHEERLRKVRGSAPERRPTIQVLSAATAHGDCSFAMLALASRTDLDKACEGTYFEGAFGQDPQAFQRGEMFERRVKDMNYGLFIKLLREKAGFAIDAARIQDLRSRAPRNTEGLKQRAAETRRLMRQIARNAKDAPNIIDGAVLTCIIAGRTAYYEADGLAAAADGKVHVAEIKSFPLTDGRCDQDKFGAACDQAAWYVLLCRRTLVEEGLSPDVVSNEGFIILADGIGLQPTLVRQKLDARIRRAERLLATAPDPVTVLERLPRDAQFPGPEMEPQARLDALEQLLDTVGTRYRPECLQDCGMARLCRSRGQASGLTALCGSAVVRQLPGVVTLERAAELAGGARPGVGEVHAAAALSVANAVYERAITRGEL